MDQLKDMSTKLKEILNLEREPVGVKFLKDVDKAAIKNEYDGKTKTRYCQALMRAGNAFFRSDASQHGFVCNFRGR